MGSRTLKTYIENPLVDKKEIERRYDYISTLLTEFILKEELRELLNNVYDLERLCGRISYGNLNARDLIQLKNSVKMLPHIKNILDEIKFEDVMMNTKNREVTIDDHVIVLTKVEYDLLKMFMEHPKEAVSRETLLQSIWGFQYDGDTRIVDVHVFKLKGKLKESRVSFKSVRGVGYKLVKKDD